MGAVPLKLDKIIELLRQIRDKPAGNTAPQGNLKVSIEEANTVVPVSLAEGRADVNITNSQIKVPIDVQDHWAENVVLLSSGARTASGTGSDVDVGRFLHGEILVDVTVVSGTQPKLMVCIDGRFQTVGKYKELGCVSDIDSVGQYYITLSPLIFRYIRVRWTIDGTNPSFTFSVSMEGKS